MHSFLGITIKSERTRKMPWKEVSCPLLSDKYYRRGGIAIIDEASGAYDCFALDNDDKGDNAQNYAWLAGVSARVHRRNK